MVKKIRRMRTFARTASKSMEKHLVENAKKLKKDPYLILPEYEDDYSKKYLGKIKKNLEKVHRFHDDSKKLEKLSKKKDLRGALAGTLLLAHSEKAPYLAVAKFPTGEVSYAKRGKADPEKLIAVQHFDNPVLRLMGIKDLVLKKDLHVYSWDKGFVSTGKQALPPEDFISFVKKKVDIPLKKGIASCKHLNQKQVENGEVQKKYYLRIHWKSADTIFAVCEDCAKSTKNTIFNITKYLLESDMTDDFLIDVVGQPVKQKTSLSEQNTVHVDKYLSGSLTDLDFIHKNKSERKESLKQSDEKRLILDGVSYGSDIHGFIKALKPNKFERKGLEFILEKVEEPVVMDDVTPNKVLEYFWEKHGLDAINSIINDKNMAEKFLALDETPSDILQMVFSYKQRQKILSQLPVYSSLPPLAKFADHIARTYKTFGKKRTLGGIKKRPDNTKGKSLAYAFLLVLEKGHDKKWQYSEVEIEYGQFLKEYAEKLLNSKPDEYHGTLQALLVASGSSENIDSNLQS